MHLHHLPLHLRQNGHATTKRQQRKLGEDQRQRNQNPAHDGHRHISSMLSGASTSMVGNSGRRSRNGDQRQRDDRQRRPFTRSGSSILIPVESSSPAAAAASPANTCCTWGSFWKRAYTTPSPTTIAVGALMRPSKAHSAPRSPRNSIPTATDRLITLPPGKTGTGRAAR